LLLELAALSGASLLPSARLRAASAPRYTDDPFSLGVASGYPTPDDVVLWTRLAPAPFAPGGGMPPEVVAVEWEVATDVQFRSIVRSGVEYATPDWAHSVHVEPGGLQPGRPYWYRFTSGTARSPVGRTVTAPAHGVSPARLRLAVASCQQYEHGYYTAYQAMVADEPDLILHLGDYIYELSWGERLIRHHGAPECYSLDDYRARYALYKSDPMLKEAHAACPWLLTWDDHEVENDYAGDVSEEDDVPEWFLARRAAAYRAYYEHQPLPRRALPYGPYLRIHTQRAFGDLANVLLLDDRQYRSPQACPKPGRRVSNRVSGCTELAAPDRSKLGARQEAWLAARLADSKARWNLLAQGTVMAYIDEQPGPGEKFWTDGWNGYPAARARLLTSLETTRVRNPICLSGDIHAFLAATLNRVAADPDSAVVAPEFVATSISSQGLPVKAIEARLRENPGLLTGTSQYRGYLRLDLRPERAQVDMVAMDTVLERESRSKVFASFTIEDGSPRPART
jgi:alkaline phosphatase D